MEDSRDLNLEKKIDAYIKGRLTKEEVEDLWIELLKRPDYIYRLETELSIKRIYEQESKDAKEETAGAAVTSISQGPLMKSWKWLAAAASVAILVIAINFLQSDSDKTLRELAVREINIVENLASPEVMRAQKVEVTSADSLLNLGYKAAISGDLEEAMKIYNEVVSTYQETPQAAMAYLNIGIIDYNAERYESASGAFEDAISRIANDPLVEEKAYWYLGNSFVNLGKLEQAREAIAKTYSMDGMYKKPALRMLEKLNAELGDEDSDGFDTLLEEE